MDWLKPDHFQVSPWAKPVEPQKPWRPDFADDELLKKAFGINLAKEPDAFAAGLITFKQATNNALWASVHWIKDEIVLAAKAEYEALEKAKRKPLDKEELLFEILNRARASEEDKDAVAAYKLYSEIAGYSGKVDINNTINNNNTTNTMKIVLVKPEKQEQQVIEASNSKSEILNDVESPIKLKLVGGSVS